MFSRRTGWDRTENPLARRLSELRAGGAPLIDLTESNPTRCGFAYPAERILPALAQPEGLVYAPDPRGLLPAREAVARHLAKDGISVDPGELLLTASTSEAYAWLFKLLCDPGDAVLAFSPSYPLFEYLTALESVELAHAALIGEGGWAVDVDEVRRSAPERTRAVIAVNPANPTGQFLRQSELDALLALCAERGWAFLCDEVFGGYGFGEDPERVRSVAGRESPALTFSLSGLSKAAGLPQLKLGWICVGGPPAERAEALARLELIADSYLSVNTPVQLAAGALLEAGAEVRRQIRERVLWNRTALEAARPEDAPWDVLPAEGGWYAVLRLPRSLDEEETCLRLLEAGVVVQPGYFFDFASGSYLVVSLLPAEDAFAEGARRLAQVLQAP